MRLLRNWIAWPFQVSFSLLDTVVGVVLSCVGIVFWSVLIFVLLDYHFSLSSGLVVLGLGVTSGILAALGWFKLLDVAD